MCTGRRGAHLVSPVQLLHLQVFDDVLDDVGVVVDGCAVHDVPSLLMRNIQKAQMDEYLRPRTEESQSNKKGPDTRDYDDALPDSKPSVLHLP